METSETPAFHSDKVDDHDDDDDRNDDDNDDHDDDARHV